MDAALEAAMEPGCCAPQEPYIAPAEEVSAAAAAGKMFSEHMASEQAKAASDTAQAEKSAAAAPAGATYLLFKTPTCPNCKAAGALLDKAGVAYTALNADEEKELVGTYGIKQAPTLVVVGADGFETYRGVSDIKGWLMHRRAS